MTLIGLVTAIIAYKLGLWIASLFYTSLAAAVVGTLAIFDRSAAFLLAIFALTLGPLCGPVLLIANSAFRGIAHPLPEPPLREPTRAERIAQDIDQGRRPSMRSQTAPSYIEVFTSGSLRDQQSALAAIARHFIPELRPALNCAQASDIPAIRAQSTAVLTQLRDVYADRARKVLAHETGLNAVPLAAEIEAISKSGFVDQQTLWDLNQFLRSPLAPRTMVSQ